MAAASHGLGQLGEQRAGVAHQLQRQRAAVKEGFAQQLGFQAVAVSGALHHGAAVGALGREQGRAHHAFAADHADLGGRAVFHHVLQRDDGVGGEIGVFDAVAEIEQVLVGRQRHQFQLGDQFGQFFQRQRPQQFILLGAHQAGHRLQGGLGRGTDRTGTARGGGGGCGSVCGLHGGLLQSGIRS